MAVAWGKENTLGGQSATAKTYQRQSVFRQAKE
jgi:hypothetical protein